MNEIRIIVIVIGALLGWLIAEKKKMSVILGIILGAVCATILVEVILGIIRGLGS